MNVRDGNSISPRIQEAVRAAARANARHLVTVFYATLQADPRGARFLNNDLVKNRLAHALEMWIGDLFASDPNAPPSVAFEEHQLRIGHVHARVKIPVSLVMDAAAILKRELCAILIAGELDRAELAVAVGLVNTQIDSAVALMSDAYMKDSVRRAQVDEAYRLFALGQDMTLERETQRATLTEWFESILFPLLDGNAARKLAPIAQSPFGMWVVHRAALMFNDTAGLSAIHGRMREIDGEILPRLAEGRQGHGDLSAHLSALKGAIEEIRFVLSELFQKVINVEAGRDPMTRALNRRFLPTILTREISIAEQTRAPFCLLMIDVDHFKQINDRWGHSAGDVVLKQVADALSDALRMNDFIFRYGGEEFLVILVESDRAEALEIAERVRVEIANRAIKLKDGTDIAVTASIGLAEYLGQADYEQLIDAADQALYKAKALGRNRIVLADAPSR